MHKSDGDNEWNIIGRIHKIPLYKNYFSTGNAICEPATEQVDKDIAKCKMIKEYSMYNLSIMSMNYSGVSLSTYPFKVHRLNIIGFAKHIIEAGALMSIHGIIHRDLHDDNILVDAHSVPRLIDFNLSLLRDIAQDKIDDMMRHEHNYNLSQEPPDSTLINGLLQHVNAEKVIQEIIYKKTIIQHIKALYNIPSQQMYKDLTYLNRTMPKDYYSWFKKFWYLVDSWSIGCILTTLLYNLKQSSAYDKTIKKYEPILFPILKKMCEVSPYNRIDCVKALYMLDPHNYIIKRYKIKSL
jgi:serine/threonine protein kinase